MSDSKLNYITWPYACLDSPGLAGNKKLAVFFGADFYNMTEIDRDRFVFKTNQCLDFIRRNCTDCELIYRPHPDEKDEIKLLNLELFTIQLDKNIAEEFLWFNRQNIKYIFSVCSTSSLSAFNMGLSSYSFYKYFEGVFMGNHKIFVEKYFGSLPADFFITDLNVPVHANEVKLQEDLSFKGNLENVLRANNGPIWFIVTENRFILAVSALNKMIKNLYPERKVNLVISRHHRWLNDAIDELRSQFDEILVFPRHFYSLEPTKLFSALVTARKIKNIQLGDGAVLFGFAHHNFIENCFISYNKDKFKAAFLPEKTWEITFRPKDCGFDTRSLKFTKAGLIYNLLFEPLLGLNRTSYKQYNGQSSLYCIRLDKQLEEVYDQVYLLKNSPDA